MIDLKLFRKDNGIRQSELCALLGVKQSYISLMESGVRPLNREKFEILRNHYGDIVDAYHEKYKQINKISPEEKRTETPAGNMSVDERSIMLQLLAEKDRVIELLKKYNDLADKYEAALDKIARLEERLHNSMADKIIIKKVEPRDGSAELN
ncbi:MAG: helix-turn-helix domain-containing protein [Candidatus Saccharibacteria bacterium]